MNNINYKELKKILLERFGTPIGERPTFYGVPDEREEISEDNEEED